MDNQHEGQRRGPPPSSSPPPQTEAVAQSDEAQRYWVGGTDTLEGTREWMRGPSLNLDDPHLLHHLGFTYIEPGSFFRNEVKIADPNSAVEASNRGLLVKNNEALRKPAITKVMQLCPEMYGLTLTVKVVSTKIVGNGHMQITECLVGDETAMIVFRAENEQVDMMKEGSTVTLRNAEIDMYQGSMRLVVNQNGRIEDAEPASFTVEEDNNMSLPEFMLVSVYGC